MDSLFVTVPSVVSGLRSMKARLVDLRTACFFDQLDVELQFAILQSSVDSEHPPTGGISLAEESIICFIVCGKPRIFC